MEIVEGLFSYVWEGQGNNCNTYAITYEVNGIPRFLLIDPGQTLVPAPVTDPRTGRMMGYGQEQAWDWLVQRMAEDGLNPADAGMVIATHCHRDHCEAAIRLARDDGVPFAFHESDLPLLKQLLKEPARQEMPGENADALPQLFLQEGELVLGAPSQVRLQVLHTPGHSPGSVCIYWPDRKALFVGDVVFYRNTGRYDLPGGDARQLRQSIEKLAKLDVEVLLSGHAYGHPGVIVGQKEVASNFSFVLTHVLP